MLSVIEIPEHCDAVLAARCSEGTVGRDRDRVDVPGVSIVVCAQLALGKLPDLRKRQVLVPWGEIGMEGEKWRGVRDLGDNFLFHRACGLSKVANISVASFEEGV